MKNEGFGTCFKRVFEAVKCLFYWASLGSIKGSIKGSEAVFLQELRLLATVHKMPEIGEKS